jgi:Rnl2 family RNA ligase
MEFKKFPKLVNTYREETIELIRQHPEFDSVGWVVTEKIHGANFSFHSDGHSIKTASRNQFVDNGFYGCGEVIGRYAEEILRLSKMFLADCWGASQVSFYGELFGDGIQKGVNYGDKDFRVFEVAVDGHPVNALFAYDKIMTEWYKNNIEQLKWVPVVWIEDSFDDAIETKESFKSYLTPHDFKGDNFAEGIVIVPDTPLWLPNGDRVYLKKKSPNFSERAKAKKQPKQVELSDEDQLAFDELASYITENRVNNVVSKIGNVTNKDFGKLLGLTVQDALEEYIDDGNGKPEKQVTKQLNKYAANIVREVFLGLI